MINLKKNIFRFISREVYLVSRTKIRIILCAFQLLFKRNYNYIRIKEHFLLSAQLVHL